MTTTHQGGPAAYWDAATRIQRRDGGPRSWRQYCDTLHSGLLEEWTDGARSHRALKTDLFDEAARLGLVPEVARLADEVHAIDISAPVSLEAAAKYPSLRCTCADVRVLPYQDGAFDLVVSNSTLDHFARRSQIDEALREIHRVTAVGGTLMITMDNLDNPVIRLRSILPFTLLRWSRVVPYYVGMTVTEEELVTELERAGFCVQQTRTMMHSPRVVAMIACRLADAFGTDGIRRVLLRILRAAERMERLPSRRRTGYYAAALAIRAQPPPRGRR